MNKFSLIIIFFIFSVFSLKSQEKIKKDSIIDRGKYPKVLVKLAPLATIDIIELSIQPSVEIQFTNNIAWQGEVNFYFPGVVTNYDNDDSNPYAGEYNTGFKIKNQVRFYLNDEYSFKNNYQGSYIAIEHFYKKIDKHYNEALNSTTGDFKKVCDLINRKKVNAFHMVYGKQTSFSNKIPLGIDVYGGFGIRYKDISIVDAPTGFEIKNYDGPFWGDSKGKRIIPSLTAGFRLTFTIR